MERKIDVIAGSPGLDWTGRAVQATRIAKILEADEAGRLPQAKRQLLHRAVVTACDATDGVTDGLRLFTVLNARVERAGGGSA